MSRGEAFAAKSEPLTLSVKAASNSQAGEWFLPAKSVELQAQWQTPTPTFKVGEAVTRKIDLIALGATPEQLPKLTLPDTAGVKFYVDSDQTASRETPQGTKALRELSISVVPTQSGEITLPELSVKWLNTQTNKQETATLPAQTITVQGASNATQNKTQATQTPTPTQNKTTSPHQTTKVEKNTDNDKDSSILFIVWLIIGAAVGGIAVWLRQKRQIPVNTNDARDDKNSVTNPNPDTLVKNVENALAAQNAKQLYQALLQWQRSGVSFTAELQQHFQQLEQLCYHANSNTTFDWQSIKQAIQQQKSVKAKHTQTDGKNLPPLY